MSKLVYPSNGIYPLCSGKIDRASEHLSDAIAGCNFDIPSGFSQRGYLDGLSGKLNGYRRDLGQIDSKLGQTDRSFSNLSDHLTASASKITVAKIAKRDRMVI